MWWRIRWIEEERRKKMANCLVHFLCECLLFYFFFFAPQIRKKWKRTKQQQKSIKVVRKEIFDICVCAGACAVYCVCVCRVYERATAVCTILEMFTSVKLVMVTKKAPVTNLFVIQLIHNRMPNVQWITKKKNKNYMKTISHLARTKHGGQNISTTFSRFAYSARPFVFPLAS